MSKYRWERYKLFIIVPLNKKDFVLKQELRTEAEIYEFMGKHGDNNNEHIWISNRSFSGLYDPDIRKYKFKNDKYAADNKVASPNPKLMRFIK
jgi:hypothetical protein